MTSDEIQKMAAVELDAAIARDVMKWFLPRDIGLGGADWEWADAGWLRLQREPDEPDSAAGSKGEWSGYLAVEPTWREGEDGEEYQDPSRMMGTERWAPTSNLIHCHAAEERLEKMGLTNDFADRLMLVSSDAQAADEYRHSFNWYFAHASASDRAKAILVAAQGKESTAPTSNPAKRQAATERGQGK